MFRFKNMFHNARIKLTFWYLLIIMLVSTFFSMIVYIGFTKELGRGFRMHALHSGSPLVLQDRFGYKRILPFVIYPDEVAPQEYIEIVDFARKRFLYQLILINGIILLMAGTSGYFLAGKTLHPIEVMVENQKRFIADASHELRTPLSSLKIENEVALRDKKMRLIDAKKLLQSNLVEIDKMKDLTDHLMTLSRYESNGKSLNFEKLDLREVITKAIERNRKFAHSKKTKIEKNVSKEVIRGEPQSLIELISILLNNAIKYSHSNSKITIETKKKRQNVIITIKDKGIGIEANDLKYIFDRFYRADSSRSKNERDGFGLGLSIAKSIVESHNGEIKVKSEVGKGTTFKVILPA